MSVNGNTYTAPKLNSNHETIDKCFGPERTFPGKLSVSRTIGDIYAKDPALGGNPRVVIPNPDSFKIRIKKKHDFVVLGSDGIYDMLSTDQVIKIVWDTIDENFNKMDIHKLS